MYDFLKQRFRCEKNAVTVRFFFPYICPIVKEEIFQLPRRKKRTRKAENIVLQNILKGGLTSQETNCGFTKDIHSNGTKE